MIWFKLNCIFKFVEHNLVMVYMFSMWKKIEKKMKQAPIQSFLGTHFPWLSVALTFLTSISKKSKLYTCVPLEIANTQFIHNIIICYILTPLIF